MIERFFKVNQNPKTWGDANGVCHRVVTKKPWEHSSLLFGSVIVKGRRAWGAPEPIWRNEVIYYNLAIFPLESILTKIVIHHTNNSNSILDNEKKQQSKGYAALGYHFFIDKTGSVYEGRPLEVMGSHAGRGKVSGPINDPDWGAVGIVLQGDYHHDDDIFFSSKSTDVQLKTLEKLVSYLKSKYYINKLLMHREVVRSGTPTVCPGDSLVPIIDALRKKLKMKVS